MRHTLIATAAATFLLSGAAFAQSNITPNPVPGTSAGEESKMPAGAASTVTTTTDAPPVDNGQSASSVPVPGNNSGIDATAPVVPPTTGTDATPVPTDTANPVPGTSAGEDTKAPAN